MNADMQISSCQMYSIRLSLGLPALSGKLAVAELVYKEGRAVSCGPDRPSALRARAGGRELLQQRTRQHNYRWLCSQQKTPHAKGFKCI